MSPPRLYRPLVLLLLFQAGFSLPAPAQQAPDAAPPNDSIRVSVTLNQDGSHTSYQFDSPNHKAVATTTERDGKLRTKIEYVLDDAGRFGSGRVYGADGKFAFRTVYKYDAAGHLLEESRFTGDNQPAGKIVYQFDSSGKQTGYAIYDKDGHLLGKTTPVTPTPSGHAHGR